MEKIYCKNIQRLDGLDFESYKILPQLNFSYLKNQRAGVAKQISQTPKIVLGKLVDDILTGGKVDMLNKLYPHAKKIAHFLQDKFGHVLPFLAKQVSFTGELHYNGIALPVKGRPDFELLKSLIIDLKVTHAKDVRGVINYMRYEDQQWVYAKLAQVKEAYILSYSVPLQKADIIPLQINDYNEFWADKILKFGKLSA
jgi:hypothetical protein